MESPDRSVKISIMIDLAYFFSLNYFWNAYFMFMGILSTYVSMYCMQAVTTETTRGQRAFETGVTDPCV